jgi:hypothetical protein
MITVTCPWGVKRCRRVCEAQEGTERSGYFGNRAFVSSTLFRVMGLALGASVSGFAGVLCHRLPNLTDI